MGEIREETIHDYYCLRCSIRATVWKINYELQNYPNSYDNYEKKALEMQIEFLENYKATHRVLDEDEFKPEFQKFKIFNRISDLCFPMERTESTIKRRFTIARAPKILCVHLNRLADYTSYGNFICKSSLLIKSVAM